MASPARTITVYRNGDPHFAGKKVVIARGIPNLEVLLADVTEHVGLEKAARSLRTPARGKRVRTLDALQDGGVYVAVGRERFQRLPYLAIQDGHSQRAFSGKPMRGNPKPMAPFRQAAQRVTKTTTRARYNAGAQARRGTLPYGTNNQAQLRLTMPADSVQNRTIHVFRNGEQREQGAKVFLDARTLASMDKVLQHVTDKVKLRTGAVKCLHTMKGRVIGQLEKLRTGGKYVAVGFGERFKRADYASIPVAEVTRARQGSSVKPEQLRKPPRLALSKSKLPMAAKSAAGSNKSKKRKVKFKKDNQNTVANDEEANEWTDVDEDNKAADDDEEDQEGEDNEDLSQDKRNDIEAWSNKATEEADKRSEDDKQDFLQLAEATQNPAQVQKQKRENLESNNTAAATAADKSNSDNLELGGAKSRKEALKSYLAEKRQKSEELKQRAKSATNRFAAGGRQRQKSAGRSAVASAASAAAASRAPSNASIGSGMGSFIVLDAPKSKVSKKPTILAPTPNGSRKTSAVGGRKQPPAQMLKSIPSAKRQFSGRKQVLPEIQKKNNGSRPTTGKIRQPSAGKPVSRPTTGRRPVKTAAGNVRKPVGGTPANDKEPAGPAGSDGDEESSSQESVHEMHKENGGKSPIAEAEAEADTDAEAEADTDAEANADAEAGTNDDTNNEEEQTVQHTPTLSPKSSTAITAGTLSRMNGGEEEDMDDGYTPSDMDKVAESRSFFEQIAERIFRLNDRVDNIAQKEFEIEHSRISQLAQRVMDLERQVKEQDSQGEDVTGNKLNNIETMVTHISNDLATGKQGGCGSGGNSQQDPGPSHNQPAAPGINWEAGTVGGEDVSSQKLPSLLLLSDFTIMPKKLFTEVARAGTAAMETATMSSGAMGTGAMGTGAMGTGAMGTGKADAAAMDDKGVADKANGKQGTGLEPQKMEELIQFGRRK